MSRWRVRVVVSDPEDAEGLPPGLAVPAERYLEDKGELSDAEVLVVNLCRSYAYGSLGYYVSLLADARGQQALPTVETSQGLAEPYGAFRALQEVGVATVDAAEMAARRRRAGVEEPGEDDAESAVPIVREQGDGGREALRPALADEMAEALVVLGSTPDARFRAAARAAFREWPAPVLRLSFLWEDGEWRVYGVAPAAPHELDAPGREALAEALRDQRRVLRRGREEPREARRASIAVLVDPADAFAPSSPETIDRLERAAARRNVHVHRIGPGDLRKLPEYDALFIRTLTGVSLPAFQFALRAEALDMPVVDDSQSIIRCSNKVFLEELLRREGLATPRTRILTASTPWAEVAELGTPLVVKLPDSSFSEAVHRVEGEEDYRRRTAEMFRRSPLIIAQEWLPTDFDWRVAVLGGRVLFTARYHMARGHWQIRSEQGGTERFGRVEAVPRDAAPPEVVETALRAAALVGDGFYGVDLKETPRGPVVIEVNDNPNLDAGYDDTADAARIYHDVLDFFLARIEAVPPGDEAEEVEKRSPDAPGPPRRGGSRARHYRPFEVAGMELEYPTVDRDLEVVSLVEPALRALAGRGTSDLVLGPVAFSNEIADHVFEVKTTAPVRTLAEAEEALVGGVRRFAETLAAEWDARLLPTGMHPWMDPRRGRVWSRSGRRIYQTYARLFDVQTHGWMNVQAAHLNLPMGREEDAVALHTAAALLLPYLPALAASTPMHDGRLQDAADARLQWILQHQARIPESCGVLVPEYVESLDDYRRRILHPMYAALDRLPGTEAIRHDFFNARGAVFKFGRRALEVRVLDTQECVRMDVALAVFTRAALEWLAGRVSAGIVDLPPHEVLVADFRACIADGTAALVSAPHLGDGSGGGEPRPVRDVLRSLLERAEAKVPSEDRAHLDLVAGIVEHGTLSERIRAALAPSAADEGALREAARRVYGELAECLVENRPWRGRTAR